MRTTRIHAHVAAVEEEDNCTKLNDCNATLIRIQPQSMTLAWRISVCVRLYHIVLAITTMDTSHNPLCSVCQVQLKEGVAHLTRNNSTIAGANMRH